MTVSRRKKISFVFHNSGITGASLLLLRYIIAFSETNRYEMSFLLPGRGKIGSELSKYGNVVDLNKQETPSLTQRIFAKLGFKKQVKPFSARVVTYLNAHAADLVYCNTLASSEIVVACKEKLSAPVILHVHELKNGLKLTGIDPTIALEKADCVIANSNSTLRFLTQDYPVVVSKARIHYPIVPESNVKQHREGARFVVGSSGTALPTKGALTFIELAAAVRKIEPSGMFHFEWVGNYSKYKVEIEERIAKHNLTDLITFSGETEVPFERYQLFDLFVSTSQEESFGMACMECAALGIPVAGFKGAGEIENLVSGCNGLLAPMNNVEELATAIVRLRDDKSRRIEMSKAGVEYAKQFTSKDVMPGVIDTIEKVLDKSKN